MKQSVYLDTTIFSYLFDERESLKAYTDVTRDWWQTQRLKYNVYISLEVLAELYAGNYPRQEEITQVAETIAVLPRLPEIEQAAELYIVNFVMPQNATGDAIHLAYASVYRIDFLLTWNCRHLANANKKRHIQQINLSAGFSVPEIITPLELFSEDES